MLRGDPCLFGFRAVSPGTSLLCLSDETLEKLRMVKTEVDLSLLKSEEYMDKHGVP